jgi:hypothetical protein
VVTVSGGSGIVRCWAQDKSPTQSSKSVVKSSTTPTEDLVNGAGDLAITGFFYPQTRSATLSVVCITYGVDNLEALAHIAATGLNSATTQGPLHSAEAIRNTFAKNALKRYRSEHPGR